MISVLAPSRGRPNGLERLRDSLRVNTTGEWELVVRLDEDDPTAAAYPTEDVRYLVGPRRTLSDLWNECWRAAKGDVFMLCADDIVFRTPGWDTMVLAAFPADGIAYVHGDDKSPNTASLGTHGFVRREWTDTIGMFAPDCFSSDFTDLWLTEVAEAVGRRVFLPDVVTEHLHFAWGKSTLDLTYAERLVRHWKDDVAATWDRTADQRQAWAALLAERIGQ